MDTEHQPHYISILWLCVAVAAKKQNKSNRKESSSWFIQLKKKPNIQKMLFCILHLPATSKHWCKSLCVNPDSKSLMHPVSVSSAKSSGNTQQLWVQLEWTQGKFIRLDLKLLKCAVVWNKLEKVAKITAKQRASKNYTLHFSSWAPFWRFRLIFSSSSSYCLVMT